MKIKIRKIRYLLHIVLYVATIYFVPKVAASQGTIQLGGGAVPVSSLTGVLSSVADICVILLVVFFYKPGFITAIILLLGQFPILLAQYVIVHNVSTIPGFFRNLFDITAVIIIYRRQKKIMRLQEAEVGNLKQRQSASLRLFEQTSTALVNAIDAKDTYSHGHSLRVAEYSERIAMIMGKSEEEIREIYYAALLHDVGKIGIPNSIINKKGKLTPEEYDIIKQHPVKGNSILSSISEYPYLSIGAHYHHERYDGKGYPDKLKGEDIPEIARIISVADAYDAMSSNRSYRDVIPQQLVREEIIKGAGTQFDPEIAKIMQHMIDVDTEYRMREKVSVSELAGKDELVIGEYRSEVSDGIHIDNKITKVSLTAGQQDEPGRGVQLILFDSLDGRFHDDEKRVRELIYFEYCSIWLNGSAEGKGVRKIETKITPKDEDTGREGVTDYKIEAVKYRDHVLIKIDDGSEIKEITIALPDSSRFVYLGLTGEMTDITNVAIERESEEISADYIPRIAEEISYIDGPEGDIPNVQVDGFRTQSSQGIEISTDMKISFHSMSLPTARLVWHCPYFVIYSSDDGSVNGDNYKEYALVRLDGEGWEYEGTSDNRLIATKRSGFEGWDVWKEKNKKGIDVSASFISSRGVIAVNTENLGIFINNTTIISDNAKKIYVALTGDQCAITDIRIIKG